MSSGKFSLGKYEANDNTIHPIRVQPETKALLTQSGQNNEPAGDINSKIPAKVSGGVREFCLVPRIITIAFKTSAPDGYKLDSPIRLPILTKATFDDIQENQTVTYLGQTATVIGKRGERPE